MIYITNSDISILLETEKQLRQYFAGERQVFDLPLKLIGTDFQLSVWHELEEIPYGETISYQELAGRVGDKKKSRAVGNANGINPIPIIIPCHRVIRKNGDLISSRCHNSLRLDKTEILREITQVEFLRKTVFLSIFSDIPRLY